MYQSFRKAWATLNPVSKVAFSVAIGAFGTALLGMVINQVFTHWMAAGGMAGVGLFYLAMGILNLEWRTSSIPRETQNEEEFVATTYHRPTAADVTSLTGERIRQMPHSDHQHARENELVSARG